MIKYFIVKRNNILKVNERHDFANITNSMSDTVRHGENYAFQIIIETDTDCTVKPSPEASPQLFCINFGGTDYRGKKFEKELALHAGEQQILWYGVHIAIDSTAKLDYRAVIDCGGEKLSFDIALTVEGEALSDGGESDPERMSRLGWFNSTLAQSDTLTKGYTPVEYDDGAISILGRKIFIANSGLPKSILTYFDKNIRLSDKPHKIADEITLILKDGGGNILPCVSKNSTVLSQSDCDVTIFSESEGDGFKLGIKGVFEFDGFVEYNVTLTAERDIEFSDISLNIPYAKPFEKLCMGLGKKGGLRPQRLDFKWDAAKHQNSLWAGDINGGLRCEFKGEDFVPPLVNIYYRHRPYHMPKSFCNGGKGGITFIDGILNAYSGSHILKAGDVLRFDFDLLITPLKEMDMAKRLRTHYYHAVADPERIKSSGGTCMINHHASEPNPYINYPFLRNKEMKAEADLLHENGIKYKIYYTMRELSDHMCEWQAARSLGNEIFPRPNGSMQSVLWEGDRLKWFAENIGTDLIPAWQTEFDSAAITDGNSRLCNYYIEGLDWLVKNIGIDGIYIDDTSIDRVTMRRTRRVLEQLDEPLVDLHTWNHYCELAGYGNSLNQYMTLLPYIDSVWIGESFNHHAEKPDFWITEIIGLPYGVTGELLQQYDNEIFRGLLFGVTSRLSYSPDTTVEIVKFIDDYKLADMEMWGFWNEETPIKTNLPDVYATLFKGEKYDIVIIATWTDEDRPIDVRLDLMGYLPEIKGVQSYADFNGNITVTKGAVIVVKKDLDS